MTEGEWICCDDPGGMLEFARPRVPAEAWRLAAAAVCRRIGHLLRDQRSLGAVTWLEQPEPGEADAADIEGGWHAGEVPGVAEHLWALRTDSHHNWERKQDPHIVAATAVALAAGLHLTDAFDVAASAEAMEAAILAVRTKGECAGAAVFVAAGQAWRAAWKAHGSASWNRDWGISYVEAYRAAKATAQAEQASLLIDLFDRRVWPARCGPVGAWRTPLVEAIAREIYELRRYELLPVLGDALQDAGCPEHELLAHLRSRGPHVFGCWALDAVRGDS